MSNEEIEMEFIAELIEIPIMGGLPDYIYNIRLTNKTDRTIYIDKGNCFRLESEGKAFCYYDNSEQITVNHGGATGVSIGLGSVAGALGFGGIVGQLADGVNVGGGTSNSVSRTYAQQRVIAIPPHGNRNLTDEHWAKTKSGHVLAYANYEPIEEAERFGYSWKLHLRPYELGLTRGIVKRGETRTFDENDLPWKRKYYITYSSEEDFKTYSTLNAELYMHEIIGDNYMFNIEKKEKYIVGINEYTIFETISLDKSRKP
ncbi:MAG: hypothetical protein IJV34_04285 [Prevotella sp.]|nr:hypothetical protein [Prevotella sp.]